MDYTTVWAQVLVLVAGLTIFVNIITEVVKNAVTWLNTTERINVFVVVLSEVFTVIVCVAYYQMQGLEMTWYLVVGFFVIGILVAYAAMFGYDKLMCYFSTSTD
ncbi:hypothetical protein [Chakrabartyella piscis]|uniref:hypothetical protein n=1 Tax=Chakrabartyella piscis TaxID=2918914 RepID=UPI002958A9EA|nr:hypothetical protein [Chakrabartyella piscis]